MTNVIYVYDFVTQFMYNTEMTQQITATGNSFACYIATFFYSPDLCA